MATPQRLTKLATEVRTWRHDFTPKLDPDELLTGTPAILEVTSSDLTLDNKTVSTEQLMILGNDVRIAKAVTFRVAGGSSNTDYTITVSIGTTSSPAQTVRDLFYLRVLPDS